MTDDTNTATDDQTTAVFEITEHTEVACLWFGERVRVFNVVAMLMREPDRGWHARVRIRMYRDARVFGSADTRDAYTLTPKDPSAPVGAQVVAFDSTMRGYLADMECDVIERVELHTVGWHALDAAMRGKPYWQRGKPDDDTRKAGM